MSCHKNGEWYKLLYGEWYKYYTTLSEAKENCQLLPKKYQKGCELFCDLNLTKNFKLGTYQKIQCPI